MKLITLILLACLSAASWSQISNELDQWKAQMEDEKRSVLADKIIFKYKYAAPEKADSVLNVISKSKDLKDWNWLIKAEFEKARGNYHLSNAYLDSCIDASASEFLTIKAHCNQAKVYTTSADLGNALDHFQVALDLSKAPGYAVLRAEIYAAMGEFYRKTMNFDIALEYLDSAQTLADENNIYDAVNIDILDRKAAVYSEKGQLDSMVYYAHLALDMAVDQQNLHAQAVSHNELGYYFEHQPDFDSAYFHYDAAIAIWKEMGALRYLANALFNKGRLLIKDNRFGEAKNFLFETEKISQNKKWHELYPRLYEHITLVYQKEGDSTNYYKYRNKTTQAYFENYVIENEKKIIELRSELELDKSKDTIEMQRKEIASLRESIQKNGSRISLLNTVIIVFLVLLLLVMLLFFRVRKQRQQ